MPQIYFEYLSEYFQKLDFGFCFCLLVYLFWYIFCLISEIKVHFNCNIFPPEKACKHVIVRVMLFLLLLLSFIAT